MERSGLLFIPDISGFTSFVNSVELNHSKHIIRELLETLLKANEIKLQVSELEGDAILFYKMGESPDLDTIYKQVEKMFLAFHSHLERYEGLRTCQCNACISAIELSLKVITHYGEFSEYRISDFVQLIGKDVIIAHQLLKNDIEKHEYWLVTNDLLGTKLSAKFTNSVNWDRGSKQVNDIEIPFHFIPLSHLRKN